MKPKKRGTPATSARGALARLEAEARTAKERQAARAESLLALIERKKALILDTFYEIGEALRTLQREKLYTALGYSAFSELLAARNVMSLANAKELIAIVEHTPREIALELGQAKSLELVRWTRATPAVDTPASVVRANEAIDGVPIMQISARGLARARRKLRAGQRRAAGEQNALELEAAPGVPPEARRPTGDGPGATRGPRVDRRSRRSGRRGRGPPLR